MNSPRGGAYLSPRYHHLNNTNKKKITKNFFRATLVFSIVILFCLVFHHSVSPIQHVFDVTYNSLSLQSNNEAIDTSISSEDLLSTEENLQSKMKYSYDDENDLSRSSISDVFLLAIKDGIARKNPHSSSSLSDSDSDTDANVGDLNSSPRDDENESFSSTFGDKNGANPLHDRSSSSLFDSTPGNLSSVLDNIKGNNVQTLGNNNGNSSLLSASSNRPKVENSEKKLKNILRKAAMPDKTVILTTINAAWTTPGSIFDLFMESFRIGIQTKRLLKHLIIIALDQTAYSRCKEVHPYCYVLSTKGINFTGEAAFMSEDYLALMWRRIEFLRLVLQTGFNFIFTDADVLWFRNPLPHLHPDADFQIACDYYLYNSTDKNNKPNGGFTYAKSNNRTIEFYKFWHNAREKIPGCHDQDVFNVIKYDPLFDQIGLRMRFLTTAYYGGFCQQSEDLNLVCTMHANCCVGIDHKIHDLKMLIDDWKRYLALSNEERRAKVVSFTVPRLCGPEKAKPISNLP